MTSIEKQSVYLVILTLILLNTLSGFSQIKLGFHYKIKSNNGQDIHYEDNTSSDISSKIPRIINVPASKSAFPRLEKTMFSFLNWFKTSRYVSANLSQGDDGRINIEFWSFDGSSSNPDILNGDMARGSFYYIIKSPESIKIPPRYYVSIPYALWQYGALTIPFKFRFGYRQDAQTYNPNDASLGVNAGMFLSRTWGRTRFFLDKTNTYDPISFSIVGFFTPTAITINADNTIPGSSKASNELALSFGPGFMFNINSFNVGFFYGFDIGLGHEIHSWLYDRRPWIGFGIGYNIGMMGTKQ